MNWKNKLYVPYINFMPLGNIQNIKLKKMKIQI